MLRLLLSGLFIGTVIAQGPIASCCDPILPACQDAISTCITSNPTSNVCQSLACITPIATPKCCDGTLATCQEFIRMCMTTASNPVLCQYMACPTAIPSPRCCDGSMPQCQDTIKLCMATNINTNQCYTIACPSMSPKPQESSSSNLRGSSYESPSPNLRESPNMRESPSSMKESPSNMRESSSPNLRESPSSMKESPSSMKESPSSMRESPSSMKESPSSMRESPSSMKESPSKERQSALHTARPTIYIKPLFSQVSTPFPKRSHLPVNTIIPDRISSTVTLYNANIAMLRTPEKIQEIQAALACALHTPLENIEIQSIRSPSTIIDFSMARMSSNGAILCMIANNTAKKSINRRNLMRQLQASDNIIITYDIINPPEPVLTVDNLVVAVASDTTITAFADSIGASVVSNTSPPPAYVSQPNIAGIVIGIVCGVSFLIAIVAVVNARYRRKSTHTRSIVRTVQIKDSVWHTITARTNPIDRTIYQPSQIRV